MSISSIIKEIKGETENFISFLEKNEDKKEIEQAFARYEKFVKSQLNSHKIAGPHPEGRCMGRKADGKRCHRRTKHSSHKCHDHRSLPTSLEEKKECEYVFPRGLNQDGQCCRPTTLVADGKSLCGIHCVIKERELHDSEEEEEDEESKVVVSPKLASPCCEYIIKRGSLKGMQCRITRSVITDDGHGFCKHHCPVQKNKKEVLAHDISDEEKSHDDSARDISEENE
jgi:hypothetical protein